MDSEDDGSFASGSDDAEEMEFGSQSDSDQEDFGFGGEVSAGPRVRLRADPWQGGRVYPARQPKQLGEATGHAGGRAGEAVRGPGCPELVSGPLWKVGSAC
jgi:hypothetical protein